MLVALSVESTDAHLCHHLPLMICRQELPPQNISNPADACVMLQDVHSMCQGGVQHA